MYLLHWTHLFFQIVLSFVHVKRSSSSSVVATSTFVASNYTVNGSSSTLVGFTATIGINTSSIQPTEVSSTEVIVASSSVSSPSTSSPPSEGAQQAVVLTVAGMTVGDFEEKKSSFLSTLKTVVEVYCSNRPCAKTSRKRRATSVEQVYIVPGYPQESTFTPGDLLVAVFVSTGRGEFLSKDVLVTIIKEFRGNLSSALGKDITAWGRLHLDLVKTTDSSESASGKSKLLYYFFAGFAGALLILAVCIFVTCWIGRRDSTENESRVRPLTTSNLELIEE